MRPEADLYGDLWKLLVTPRSHDLDTYEWLCAAEQTLSDLRTLGDHIDDAVGRHAGKDPRRAARCGQSP